MYENFALRASQKLVAQDGGLLTERALTALSTCAQDDMLSASKTGLVKLWRAMSPDELAQTLKELKPSFIGRFKWFSDNPVFIKNRVLDGKFNHSQSNPDRYSRLIELSLQRADMDKFQRVAQHELMLDRRKAHLVRWLSVNEIDKQTLLGLAKNLETISTMP